MSGSNFNSIKVRLERFTYPANSLSSLFQFHKGTIRTFIMVLFLYSLFDFNSIKVRLEREPITIPCLPSIYFNSIKVRLEPNSHGSKSKFLGFQFHKGTIRTRLPQRNIPFRLYFNSIKVRLELMPIIFWLKALLFQFHKGTIRTQSARTV